MKYLLGNSTHNYSLNLLCFYLIVITEILCLKKIYIKNKNTYYFPIMGKYIVEYGTQN